MTGDDPRTGSSEGVLAVRPLPGANCSSIGSVVDMLFVAGAVGGVLLVAATAALSGRDVELVGPTGEEPQDDEGDDASAD